MLMMLDIRVFAILVYVILIFELFVLGFFQGALFSLISYDYLHLFLVSEILLFIYFISLLVAFFLF
jgi:hypothetical protein